MLKTTTVITMTFALLLAGVFAYAWSRPDTFRVQRALAIKASPETLFPLITDLQQFNRWNPFVLQDTKGNGRYSGSASGKGAAYEFEGGSSGSGNIEIVGVTAPRQVLMTLTMTKPLAANHAITFSLEPAGDLTMVTWAMEGKTPLLGRIVHLVMDMDRMIGNQFASGLAGLKRLAEKP